MSLRNRWISLLRRTAASTRKTRIVLTPIGFVIFGTFPALFVLAGIWVDRLLGLPGLLPDAARLPVSLPLIAAGVFVTTWSVVHFSKVKGTPVPFNPPPKRDQNSILPFKNSSTVKRPNSKSIYLLMLQAGSATCNMHILIPRLCRRRLLARIYVRRILIFS
jgi:hypothetical protein